MKRALIFYNGNLSDLSHVKKYVKERDFIICADGGAKHAFKLGLIPHVIIGDLDSLAKSMQKKLEKYPINWIKFQKEKDETDSELAVNYAVEEGFKQILIFGLLGSRIDHFLTNIFAISNYEKQGINIVCIEGKQEIQVSSKKIILEGKAGDLVSLIPLHGNVSEVTTSNLEYKLTNEDLYFGKSRGISNVMTKDSAEVSLQNGLLLVIHTKN